VTKEIKTKEQKQQEYKDKQKERAMKTKVLGPDQIRTEYQNRRAYILRKGEEKNKLRAEMTGTSTFTPGPIVKVTPLSKTGVKSNEASGTRPNRSSRRG
jgi:hypothetical protein